MKHLFFSKEYKSKKDSSFLFTLTKLKKIYESLGIKVNVSITKNLNKVGRPYSHHMFIDKYSDLGANGKGKTEIASLCSGYAELTERFQNAFIINFCSDEFFHAPDEKIYDINNCPEFIKEYIKNYFLESNVELTSKMLSDIASINFLIPQNYPSSRIFDIPSEKINNLTTVPFYSVFENKVVELPLGIVRAKNLSNGMCAGNSKEEALVQGISEIIERYVSNYVFNKECALPQIPQDFYKDYPSLINLIKYIETVGNFSIRFYDASLGQNLPVVMSMFVDNDTNNFSLFFGAHPDFTIAIERCLTEFMQGINVSDSNTKKNQQKVFLVESMQKEEYNRIIFNCCGPMYFDIEHPLYKNLVNLSSEYVLNEKYFEKQNLNKNNKQLLSFLLNIIKDMGKDIYVRDVSFLGFNSFTVDIPGLSECKKYSEKEIYSIKCQIKTSDFFCGKLKKDEISNEEILLALDKTFASYYSTNGYFIKNIPNQLLNCIIHLENNDKEKALEFLHYVIEHKNISPKLYDLCFLMCIFLEGNSISLPNNKYLNDILEVVINIMKNPLDCFLDFIKKEQLFVNYPNAEREQFISNIRALLVSKYKQNLIDQSNCRKIFEGIN